MRSIDSATIAYLQARAGVVARQLLWIVAKNRDTGDPEEIGFWDDLDTLTMSVISGEDGSTVSRTYIGAGALLEIDAIPLVSDLSVRTISVSLSGVSTEVAEAVRTYDPRLAAVEIHRALFDTETRELIAPPIPHFVGRINRLDIPTPEVGGDAVITAEVVSHTRELTRSNPAKRSDETQKLRSGDRFRRYTGVANKWDVFWGEKKASVPTTTTSTRPVTVSPGTGGFTQGSNR